MWDATDDDDETDFDAIARDVGERLAEVTDPRVKLVLHGWLTRLTAGRGPVEFGYLRLLRFMMDHRRIGRPFRRRPPPPTIHLPPLDERVRPRAGADAGRRRTARGAGSCGGSWTDGDRDDDDGRSGRAESRHADHEDASAAAAASATTATTTAADGVSECVERDGHLAGGGKGKVCCGASAVSDGKRTVAAAPRDVSDPCLDDWALHLRKRRPRPIDAEYAHLLVDCPLPEPSDAERDAADPQLLRVVRGVDDETTLQEFYFKVFHRPSATAL